METDSWLTAVRTSRLRQILQELRRYRSPGLSISIATKTLWNVCGGVREEISGLIQILIGCRLVTEARGHYALTKKGLQIATHDHQHEGRFTYIELIRGGVFAEQARRLVEVSDLDTATGALVCPRQLAQSVAPQLFGLLRQWPDVDVDANVHVPSRLARELLDIWVQEPPSRMGGDERKNAIAVRAEQYSYRFERNAAADPTKIHWVARDNDQLGFDIEDTNPATPRRIEVKASGGHEVRFFLSANELRVASELRDRYEIQFWGEINMAVNPATEFDSLQRSGYPLRFVNPADLIENGTLSALCQKYVVTVD